MSLQSVKTRWNGLSLVQKACASLGLLLLSPVILCALPGILLVYSGKLAMDLLFPAVCSPR